MAVAGKDGIVAAQIFVDGLRLGGRFDEDDFHFAACPGWPRASTLCSEVHECCVDCRVKPGNDGLLWQNIELNRLSPSAKRRDYRDDVPLCRPVPVRGGRWRQ